MSAASAPAPPSPPGPDGSEAQRRVLRGGLVLMLAKAVHTLASFGLYFALAPLLALSQGEGAVAAFGVWGTTLLIANPLNMTFAQGTLQLVSRTVASRADAPRAAFAACARRQVPLILGAAVAYQLAVPAIATHYLQDPSYEAPLRVGGLIFPAYGLRALYQGWCNGVQDFRRQSWLDMGTSILRMVAVLGVVAAGASALGALGAFVAAALALLVVAWLWIRPGPPEDGAALAAPGLLRFQLLVMAVTLATFFLMSQDQVAVKAHAHPDPAVTDRLAGYFTGCLKIAQIPWAIVSALVWVLFPLVAERSGRGDGAGQAAVLREGFRLVLLLLVPVAAGLSATAAPTYALVFPTQVRDALEVHGDDLALVSGPLAVMAWSYLVYGLLIVSTMLLTAEGRAGTALAVTGTTLVLAHLATTAGVQRFGPAGAAAGAGLAWTLGLVGAQLALARRHGNVLPLASVLRLGAAGALVWWLARLVPGEGPTLLARDAVAAVAYLAAVLLSGERRPAELGRLAMVALRRPVA